MFPFVCSCPLCEVAHLIETKGKFEDYEDFSGTCQVSGEIHITGESLEKILLEKLDMHLLQGVIRHHNEKRYKQKGIKRLFVNTRNLDSLFQSPVVPKSVVEKMDLLLMQIGKMSDFPGQEIMFYSENDYTLAFAKNSQEMEFLFKALFEDNFLESIMEWPDKNKLMVKVTTKGWKKIHELTTMKNRRSALPESLRNVYAENYYEINQPEININQLKEAGIEETEIQTLIEDLKKDQKLIKEIVNLQSEDIDILKYAIERLQPILRKAFDKEFDSTDTKLLKLLSSFLLKHLGSDSIGDQFDFNIK